MTNAQCSQSEERLLILAPTGKDAMLMSSTLAGAGVQCMVCADIASLCREIEADAGAVLLTEEAIVDAAWQLLAGVLSHQPQWSDLPILLLTHRRADSPTVLRAIEILGNVTLMERPIPVGALVSTVRTALRARKRQYQIRTYLVEYEQAANALRQTERLYRGIGESIDYGVWICDAQGCNIYVSDSFLRLIGATQEHCAEFGWSEFLHPDQVEATMAAWKACVERGDPWDREHQFLGVDGRYHPIFARGVPVRDEQGKIIRWVGINLDISRLKQAQESLREADRRKDEFLATLAHELRNPLAPISNAVHLLCSTDLDKAQFRAASDVIARQVRQLTRLVDDLLDVSRIKGNKVEMRKELVELSIIVANAVETSYPLIDTAAHELTVTLPQEPIMLNADPARLSQVLSNLLNNAAKYTPSSGRISLVAERKNDHIDIRISDTGIGISAEMLPRIFDLFSQADHSLERAQGGLGVGLALVRRFVEKHNGTVSVCSGGLGKGSEFIVHLPIATEQARPPTKPQPVITADTKAKPRRILVVDDNTDSVESLSMLLQIGGDEIRTAKDGFQAVETATSFRPDIVLMDIGLPKMNGYEAARRMRKEQWSQDAVFIALTGWGQDEDRRLSREAGYDYHLVKPLDFRALQLLISSLP